MAIGRICVRNIPRHVSAVGVELVQKWLPRVGHGNSCAQVRQDNAGERCHVWRGDHAVRIFNGPCGFRTVFADSRAVVRIFNEVCGLPATRNRPGMVFLGLKTAGFGPIRREIPMTKSTQVLKNPHDPLEIRTAGLKSA